VPPERLQRLLARAGYGSRRACEELIVEGRVTLNGTVATLGDRGDPAQDEVRVDGLEVNLDPNVKYYALHKPPGVVTTMRDPQGRPDIRAYLPPDGPRVFPVGRLDRDTEGLLLLTNDGDLANGLTHPRFGVEKEYLAEVEGVPTPKHIGQLRRGVELEDGPASAANARVAGRSGDRGAVRLVMTEGRKREVRRLLAAVGLPVARLVRVRIGPIRLGSLGPGERRELTHDEVVGLRRVVDG
jgi:23S rRNA pseudouridine2605 synthase